MRFALFTLLLPILAYASPIATPDNSHAIDLTLRDAAPEPFALAEPFGAVEDNDFEKRTLFCFLEVLKRKKAYLAWVAWQKKDCRDKKWKLDYDWAVWQKDHKKNCHEHCDAKYKKAKEDYENKCKELDDKCKKDAYDKECEYKNWENDYHHKCLW